MARRGAPPLYKSPKELEKSIIEYFAQGGDDKSFKPTICGLVLHLGFASRQSFYDLEKREDFSYTIKRARLEIEAVYESRLHTNSPTGAIFALKNFGWEDSASQVNIGVGITVMPSIKVQSPQGVEREMEFNIG